MYNDEITDLLMKNGCSEVGFCEIPDFARGEILKSYAGAETLKFAVTLVVKLSDAVLEGIQNVPTHTYFHHYRTVNAFLDRLMLECGIYIENQGYKYIPVAASQSIGKFQALFSHKTAARLSGLGSIGKSGLFISKKYGTRVRLGTILTDMPFKPGIECREDLCGSCSVCAKLCPASAISPEPVSFENPNNTLDREACSAYMKHNFQHIGRGAVCGICVKNCAYTARIKAKG